MARFEKGDKVFEITSDDARYTTEQRKHLHEGWTRVCDPRCEVPFGAEPYNATFEDALRADPNDVGTPLVYADWLEQQSHPRGALIAIQHQLAVNPRSAELVDAERRILEEAGDSLVSKVLRVHLSMFRGDVEMATSRNLHEGGAITFDHGFIRKARLNLKERGGDEDLLWELLRHPSARVLADLDIVASKTRDSALIATLLTHGPRPPLRALRLGLEYRGTVDFQGLDEAYPLLEDLKLEIHNLRFGDLALPRLRNLYIRAEHTDLPHLLAARIWPQLESLYVPSEHEKYQVAFERPSFPRLRELSLLASKEGRLRDREEAGIFTCRMLVRSPDVVHLERVRLPNVALGDEAITMLEQSRARFERLVELEVLSIARHHEERLLAADYPLVVWSDKVRKERQ